MKLFLTCLILIGYSHFSIAQTLKQLESTRAIGNIKIDGDLSEADWQKAIAATDFIEFYPKPGQPSSAKTEVKILYTNEALYIGAYMHEQAGNIRKQLTQRDRFFGADVDYIAISLDTYDDNQNAFYFQITSANVQSDSRIAANGGDNGDFSWDAVWESRVKVTANGWYAEAKIPLYSLRFAKKNIQTWGLQIIRQRRKINETSSWAPIDPNKDGQVNQYGSLTGLEKIEPLLRLSFLPYVSGGFRSLPNINGGKTNQVLRNGGMDIKYGINESFTLDMTLIPDFGQVQSDNQVLNLSPFEVRFDEFRPFFTEGTELFNKAGLFYSRRIGSTPSGYFSVAAQANEPNTKVLKNPSTTQLYNATKISGRNKNNLGIGFFNAVSAPQHAIIQNTITKQETKIETEPLTNFNVIVLDQAFKNRSFITFTNTNVTRANHGRKANVSALNTRWVDKNNNISFGTYYAYSQVTDGEKYNGFKASASLDKISGRWNGGLGTNIESDTYDPNDLGFLQAPNEINNFAYLTYRIPTPTKRFLSQSYTVSLSHNQLYKPRLYQNTEIEGNAFFLLKNFWDMSFGFNTKPNKIYDAFEPRFDGYNMRRNPYFFISYRGSSDSRKKLFGRWFLGFAESKYDNDPFYIVNIGLRYRFNAKFNVEFSTNNETDEGQFGYSFARNNKPVIAFRSVRNFTNIVSANYAFGPFLNTTIRMRHYYSRVKNFRFFNIEKDGYLTEQGFEPGRDRQFNVFNIDAFVNWNFKPGSLLILNWKNALDPSTSFSGYNNLGYFNNVKGVFNNPHSNELTLRLIWFIDYLSARKLLGKKRQTT
jgi:hypothetical protein